MPTQKINKPAEQRLIKGVEEMYTELDEWLDGALERTNEDGFRLAIEVDRTDFSGELADDFREVWAAETSIQLEQDYSIEAAKIGLGPSFGLDGAFFSAQWVASQGATQIRQITDTTKRGIQEVLTESLQAGRNPLEAARAIKPLIGLPPRWAKAVDNLDQKLREKGLPERQRIRQVKAYAKRLKGLRARNIARSEMISAASQGHLDVWNQGVAQGVIPATVQKRWVAGMDERTCPICRPLNGQTVPLKSKFFSEVLQKEFDRPTAHASCRCTMVLKYP